MERKPAMVRSKIYGRRPLPAQVEPAKAMAPATNARNMLLKVSLSFFGMTGMFEIFGKALRKKTDLTFAELFAFEPLSRENVQKYMYPCFLFFTSYFFLITHLVLSPHLSDVDFEFIIFC